MRMRYVTPHHLPTLHDELLAAGIVPTYVGGVADDPDGVELDVPDGTDPAAVRAVVDAHDGAAALAAWEAARQAEADDNAQVRQAVATLLADAARLEDAAQALSAQQVRNHLARTDRVLAGALRVLARRLGA